MILRSPKVVLKGKTITKGISQKSGNEYTNNKIYVQTQEGIMYELSFISDYLYNSVQEGKSYVLQYYIQPNGNITLNGIEEMK